MRAEVSRADLLRILAEAPARQAAPIARLLGWDVDEQAAQTTGAAPAGAGQAPATAPTGRPAPVLYLSRPAPRYWHVAECGPIPRRSYEDEQPGPAEDEDESEQEPGPPPPQDQRIAPLLRPGQWQNLWDRLPPSRRRARAIDLPRSLRLLTRAEPVRDLPRRPRRGFNRAVALLLDWSDALGPVRDDLLQARRTLARLLGDELQSFLLPAGPAGLWIDLDRRDVAAPEAIPQGALVVIAGALGALESADISRDWQALVDGLRGAGHALFLAPVCPLRQRAVPTTPLDPAIEHADQAGAARALDTLLTALSQVWWASAARLRALRRSIDGADLHTELRAWTHDEIANDGYHATLTPEKLLSRLERYKALPEAQRARIQAQLDHWRKGLDTGAETIERLQSSLIDDPWATDYRQLQRQAARAAGDPEADQGMPLAQLAAMRAVIEALSHRTRDPGWRPLFRDVDRALGGPPLSAAERAAPEPPTHGLHQLGRDLVVRPGASGILTVGPWAYSVQTGQLVGGTPLAGLDALDIVDREHRRRLETLTRPPWAERCWCDGERLFAAHADNAIFAWLPAAPERPTGEWVREQNPWPWAKEIGVDGYGLWALLEIKRAGQRLRWIPPGRFLMGSPEDEPERWDDEQQHQVTLTRGYWLGESAATQALWQAVTGKNPSGFKGDDLPVETVSWDDCQGFLTRLAGLAPGLKPALPSEAQWEYACRAGTRTPFNFGERLDTGKANYNGDYPYNDGPKGEYRGRTLPAASFEPNAWGLYQMHGNVWEWCTDWFDDYPAEQATDPVGPAEGPGRVLRGGSWRSLGRNLRSACRDHSPPDGRSSGIGLRLAGGVDRQEEQAGPAGQAGSGPVSADGREQSGRQRSTAGS